MRPAAGLPEPSVRPIRLMQLCIDSLSTTLGAGQCYLIIRCLDDFTLCESDKLGRERAKKPPAISESIIPSA
ncbi:hypothetical protein ASE23_22120 [Rhizobium sp. Root73]|nr:hypothetical protein ASE23_22120 [Rhizobium sp. Root73]